MDLTTVHFTDRHPNSNGIGLDGNALDDALDASLAAFTADIEAAVPSYLGLQLTIGQTQLRPPPTRSTDAAGSSGGDASGTGQVDSDRRITLDADLPLSPLPSECPGCPSCSPSTGPSVF